MGFRVRSVVEPYRRTGLRLRPRYRPGVQPEELKAITAQVREVADRIQPLLDPHPGLAARNAHAHVWLGLKVVFGEEWRERAAPASVRTFLAWIDAHPNTDYDGYAGPREELSPEERGSLF